MKQTKRRIDRLIVHCSASPEGRNDTIEDIRRWHKERGYRDIGYHYVIHLDGSIHKGRDDSDVGAHVQGYNKYSIGICYIGGVDKQLKPKDTRNSAQKKALRKILQELKSYYPEATIHGHREFANKACPSFDAKSEYAGLKGKPPQSASIFGAIFSWFKGGEK